MRARRRRRLRLQRKRPWSIYVCKSGARPQQVVVDNDVLDEWDEMLGDCVPMARQARCPMRVIRTVPEKVENEW